jgi:hypothetical protein
VITTKKAMERLIEASFKKHSNGLQIPIMKLGDIFRAGKEALENGLDLDDAMKAAIDLYRVKEGK